MIFDICVPATQFMGETKEREDGEGKRPPQSHMRLRRCPGTWRVSTPGNAGALGNLSPCTKAPPSP